MPTYVYFCVLCETYFEVKKSMSDKSVPPCSRCGNGDNVEKRVAKPEQPNFILKGFRWAAKEGY